MITNGVNYSELNTVIYYLSSYWVNIAIKTVLKPFKIKHDIFISAILISR